MLLLVLALAGRPAVFPDTDDYLIHGRNTAMTVLQALRLKRPPDPPTDQEEIDDARYAAQEMHLGIAARTPWYGLPMWALQKLGTLWLVAAAQAAVGAWLVWLLWRTLAPGAAGWTAYAVQAATAAASPLPFFAGFAMPDVFAGFIVAAAGLLLAAWDRLGRGERALLAGLVGYGVTVHGSHPLLAAAMLAAGALGLVLHPRAERGRLARRGMVVAGAVIAGVAASSLSMAAVKWTTGDDAGRPPFLSVRLLADGPGRGYLRWACAHGRSYVLCRDRGLPLDDTEEMLWSDQKTLGVYETVELDVRRRLQREDLPFAVGTLAYDPGGVAAAALRSWAVQLAKAWVDVPLRDPHYYLTNDYWKDTNLPRLVEAMGSCGPDHHGCRPRMTAEASKWLHGGALVLALGGIGWALAAGATDAGLLALLLWGMTANALICGALSGPFARYQARVAWVVIAAGAAVALGRMGRSPHPPHASGAGPLPLPAERGEGSPG